MRMTAAVGCLIVSLSVVAAPLHGAEVPPVCKGINILDELKTGDPAGYQRVQAATAATKNGNALFWKIERGGTAPSYLFGTIHLTDPRVHNLPAAASDALAKADQVVLEAVDLTPERMGAAMMSIGDEIVFTDGHSLFEYLSLDERGAVTEIIEKSGMPATLATIIKPWLVTVMLAVPECESRRTAAGIQSLDASIEKSARDRGLTPIGLETPEDQLNAMASLDLDAQIGWLKASLITRERAEDALESLIVMYENRSIGGIWELTRQMIGERAEEINFEAALQGFQKALIHVRNRTMAERLEPILAKGNAFVGVGALHLPDDGGLVELLRDAGYTVTAAE